MFPTVQESEKRSLRTFKRYRIDVVDVSDRLLFVSNRLVSMMTMFFNVKKVAILPSHFNT